MPSVLQKLTDFIKEILTGWITSNLRGMFTDVNDKVGTIAGEVAKTPSTWNGNVFEEGFLPCINRPEYRGTIAALLRGKPSALQTPCMSCSIWKKMLEKGLHLEL